MRLQRYKQRQGEPVFERLKKQLEEVKGAHRGVDGSFRSAAEMDRQRQVLADQAIEEQLHAQTAFRTQGAHLQGVVNKLHAQELENRKLCAPSTRCVASARLRVLRSPARRCACNASAARRSRVLRARSDQEMKQLSSWKQTIASVILRLEDHIACVAAERAAAPDGEPPESDKRVLRLRNQFFEEMRKQLYSEAEDRFFYSEIQKGIRAVEVRLEEGEVAVAQLEAQLLNVACDDPGSTVGMVLLLPALCDRLDALAAEHAAELAAAAEQELITLNVRAEGLEGFGAEGSAGRGRQLSALGLPVAAR